jgi:hypothetical protein
MNESGMSFFFTQVGYQAPALIVYLVAFVLALTHLEQARSAAILALLGAIVSVLAMIGVAGAQAYLIGARAGNLDSSGFRQLMGVIGIGGSLMKAGGLALLVAAIFVERGAVVRSTGSDAPAVRR